MRLDAITLEHFRNYAHQSVTFDPSVNVIVGENAQGKTNLLEAAVYLSCAKSPRARTEKEMISFEADAARLTGSVFSRGRDFTVEIELSRGKRRKMSVNQVPCKRAGDLSGVLNTVYFCPDDLLLIRDGAAARRRFMDLSLSQLRPRYDAALSEYNRLYDHKTRILRDAETLCHVEIEGLYPCGEGAGYAGGIVSAAIDGERCAEQLKRGVAFQ